MEINNPLYKNIGIHLISSLFTVDKGIVKVLLIRRTNEPYKGKWALVGGAMYNNEELDVAVKREIYEKTGITEIDLSMYKVFGRIDRSPLQRMIALGYIGVVDLNRTIILKNTLKTSDAEWFPIDKIPELAYDHEEIVKASIEEFKSIIVESNILKALFPDGFTMPEILKIYETILDEDLDRRNFRKRFLSLGLIEETNKYVTFEGTKPAKVYKFKKNNKNKNVL